MMLGERFTALTLLSLAAVAGCAQFKAIVSPPPAPTPSVPAQAPRPAPPAPTPSAPTKAVPPAPPAPTPPAPTKVAPPAPAAPTPPAPAKVAPPAPPKLAPQLGQPEEERLRRDAMARIDATERIVRQITDRRLGADQQETLSTIQSFVDKARLALGTQDLQQAFTLADKAEALAQDLLRTTR